MRPQYYEDGTLTQAASEISNMNESRDTISGSSSSTSKQGRNTREFASMYDARCNPDVYKYFD